MTAAVRRMPVHDGPGWAAARQNLGRWRLPLLAGLLFLLVAVVFQPCLRNDFVNYDDPEYVTSNPHVLKGLNWQELGWAFKTGHASNWHPVTWVSHMLDCQFFGVKSWGHHLTNVLLHAGNAVLVFLVFRSLTGQLGRSLFVAALFAVHPLRVQSVAWVAERKDLLSLCFAMLSLWAYARFARSQTLAGEQSASGEAAKSDISIGAGRSGAPAYCLALLSFGLGLMSKPMVVTLPFVLLLLDFWPLQRWDAGRTISGGSTALGRPRLGLLRLVLEKIPFFLLAAGGAVVTLLVQKSAGSVKTLTYFPLGVRLENALMAYYQYLANFFWPVHLAVFYPHPTHWPLRELVLAGAVLLAFSAVALALWRTRPYYLVGWFWFLGTLVPVIGLVQVGAQSMADRYTYIPLIGPSVALTWAAAELFRGLRFPPVFVSGAALALLLGCTIATRREIAYWADSETLFRRALAVTKDNALAHLNLGVALGEKGRPEALEQYQAAYRLAPGDPEIDFNLAVALLGLGRPAEAVGYLQEAIARRPNDAEGHFHLGRAFERMERLDDAAAQYLAALRLNPNLVDAHCNLGIVLTRQNRNQEAILQFQQVLRLEPSAEAHDNLGIALLNCGRLDDAVKEFEAALRLSSDRLETRNHLGVVYLQQSRLDEAIAQFQTVLKARPGFTDAHVNLSVAFYRKGQFDQAIGEVREALRLNPENAALQKRLKVMLERQSGSAGRTAP